MKRFAVIGAGISGLTAAYYLRKKISDSVVDVWEARNRPGGVLKTEHLAGFVLEAGPDSFLTQKRGALDLAVDLGIPDQLMGSNDPIRKTFLFHEGGLKVYPEGFFLMVPSRLRSLIRTSLLSWHGKLTALRDLLSLPETRDLTVADFVSSRFGEEVLQVLAEPLLSGVYGADIHRLSLKNALPQLWEMQKKGSLIRTMLFRKNEQTAAPLFTTLRNGMQTLSDTLAQKCGNLRLSQSVHEIEKCQRHWLVNGQEYEFVILACSSFPRLLMKEGEELQALAGSMRRNSAIVIALGYDNLYKEGFGWLVPAQERKLVLACTYVTNKFPERSPAGKFLVRLFIGGREADRWLDAPEEKLLGEGLMELKRIAGIDQTPLFGRVYRWEKAMPEYAVGHENKVARMLAITKENGNFYLTGNLYAGVGIPDCIAHAKKVVDEIQ